MQKDARKINYGVAFFMVLFHLGFIVALFHATWPMVGLATLVWYTTGLPGIGVGFHRLLVHRGFKTLRWVEYILTVQGCMALQGGPITWAAAHLIHHQYAEHLGLDPHTPNEGLLWAHVGWMIWADPKLRAPETFNHYTPRLYKSQFHRVMNRIWWLPMTLFGLTFLWFGGFTVMLWGAAVPIVIGWHSTWLVNSAAHRWGSRRFDTPDNSGNIWWLWFLSGGEACHNNHHHYPSSARHGLAWYEIDLNWCVIRFLRFLGLAWDVQEAKV